LPHEFPIFFHIFLDAGLYSGIPVRFAPILEGIEMLDAQAMGLSDAEATLMDPQQRLLLEATAELLEAQQSVARQSTGVFIGLSSTDYAKVILG
jgi:acyl transferase domain-containing protein